MAPREEGDGPILIHRIMRVASQMLADSCDDHTMSRRARVYIAAGGFRHVGTGLTMLLAPWLYSSAVFIPIFNVFGDKSILAWAWMMIAVGTVCYIGAAWHSPQLSRAGIAGSAVITTILAIALTLGLVNSWLAFANQLAPGELWTLIRHHPARFPADWLDTIAPPPSPLLMIAFISFGIKDFTMCAQPLRVPLEDRRLRAVGR